MMRARYFDNLAADVAVTMSYVSQVYPNFLSCHVDKMINEHFGQDLLKCEFYTYYMLYII